MSWSDIGMVSWVSSKVFEDPWVRCLRKSNVTSDDEGSRGGGGISWSVIGRVSSRVFDALWVTWSRKFNVTSDTSDDMGGGTGGWGISWSKIGRVSWVSFRRFEGLAIPDMSADV